MARQRKQPTTAMKELEQNIAGMKSIDPALDLENWRERGGGRGGFGGGAGYFGRI